MVRLLIWVWWYFIFQVACKSGVRWVVGVVGWVVVCERWEEKGEREV
jgi:hypothetical protein